MNQTVTVRVADGESDPSVVGRGVRQGCPLSPMLFNLYAEAIMKELLETMEDGVKVGGKLIQTVRFSDDQAMIASSEEGLRES